MNFSAEFLVNIKSFCISLQQPFLLHILFLHWTHRELGCAMATGRDKYYYKGRGCFVGVHGTFSRSGNDLYLFVMKDPNWRPSVWLHGDFLLPIMTWLRVAIKKKKKVIPQQFKKKAVVCHPLPGRHHNLSVFVSRGGKSKDMTEIRP